MRTGSYLSVFYASLAFVAISFPATASAHWQFTKWGMTPAQVALAADGKAPISPDVMAKRYVGNRGSFAGGAYAFAAEYVFLDGKLDAISLKLLPPSVCSKLAADLRVKYGTPASIQSPIPSILETIWSDSKEENRVKLSQVGGECFLTYSPLNDSSSNAL